MNEQIAGWMDAKGFGSIDQFRGKVNYANYDKPGAFERTQFMKYFSSYEYKVKFPGFL